MDAAIEARRPGLLEQSLAGLHAGTVGLLWMLLWLGVSSVWQRRSFWSAENLFATVLDRNGAIGAGFSRHTISGMAAYIVIYGVLAAVFALVMHGRLQRPRLMLVGAVCGLAWYYLSYYAIWRHTAPLLWMLHAERPTMLGHLIYGAALCRFPAYLPAEEPAKETQAAEPAPVTSDPHGAEPPATTD